MLRLKTTEEYRVDTEEEAKMAMEQFRQNQSTEDYVLSAAGYTYKEKKSKGEVIDSGYLLKIVKNYKGFWDD